ncbi:MAG: hypothetical protein ACJATI_002340 [Halioglobus sp.]|jgi:hypothetical protein
MGFDPLEVILQYGLSSERAALYKLAHNIL